MERRDKSKKLLKRAVLGTQHQTLRTVIVLQLLPMRSICRSHTVPREFNANGRDSLFTFTPAISLWLRILPQRLPEQNICDIAVAAATSIKKKIRGSSGVEFIATGRALDAEIGCGYVQVKDAMICWCLNTKQTQLHHNVLQQLPLMPKLSRQLV